MKFFRLLVLVLPLLLAACGLSDQQKADYDAVQRSRVSPAIYDKMLHGDALSLYDIKTLAHAGVSDGVTLRYLRNQGTVYSLNSGDVEGLRKAGVSQSIVDYMLQTQRMYGPGPAVGIYPGPYGYYDPFYGPYPYGYGYGPYPYVGIGFYGGYHHHWH